jgi:hypothetical protein
MGNGFNDIPWVKEAKRRILIRKIVMYSIFIVFVALGFGGCAAARFANPKTDIHTIQSIDKVENVHGNKDGFSTELYWVVVTDKGTFHIMTDGFNAAQRCANIEEGKTYRLTTRGLEIPFFGFYRCIVSKQDY